MFRLSTAARAVFPVMGAACLLLPFHSASTSPSSDTGGPIKLPTRHRVHAQSKISRLTSSTSSTADIIIVGGGIVGSTLALCLKQLDPALKIILLESEFVSAGATGMSAGCLWNTGFGDGSSLISSLTAGSQQIYAQLDNVGFDQQGALEVAINAVDVDWLKERALNLKDRGYSANYLNKEEVLKLEPALAGSLVEGALHTPLSASVDAGKAAHAVAEIAISLGVDIREGARVTDLYRSDSKNYRVKTNKNETHEVREPASCDVTC